MAALSPPRSLPPHGRRSHASNPGGDEYVPDYVSFGRAVLCILLPPLAVLDKGCGSVLLVLILTIIGWVPGVLAAIFFNTKH